MLHRAAPAFVELQQGFGAVTSQTRYPSLTSSCIPADLLLLSPGLGPEPPTRLEAEGAIRKSREAAVLESRTRDDDAAEAEVLDELGCPWGSMTVLMTEEETTGSQYGNNRNLSDFTSALRFTFKLPLNPHEFFQNGCDFLKCRCKH